MKKIFLVVTFLILFFSSAAGVSAQNKAGINIGANHGDMQKAADIVGPGGWVVMMACPSDGDKIAKFIQNNPSINLIIRGHFAGMNPDANLAKAWAATLSSIPTPNKIYFMPWNEPNQEGTADYTTPADLKAYIDILIPAFSSIRSKVILLSPMINISHPNYEVYTDQLLDLDKGFFHQFDGIAMSLYDSSDGTSTDGHINPQHANQLLAKLGVSEKAIFGVEAGTSGKNFYYLTEPSSSSPLFRFVQRSLNNLPARMFAIPSYDLAGETGEKGHTWSLFDPPDVVNLLKASPKGGTTPASGGSTTPAGVNACPGKKHTFYIASESECSECGGNTSLLACKPVPASDYGEEYSPEQLKITEVVDNPRTGLNACHVREFTAKTSVQNVSIPFAYELNKYFLGPYMDNLGARVAKQNADPIKDFGVFEKLAPKELQDRLKIEFLDHVISGNSRYQNYSINGIPATLIKSRFKKINQTKKTEDDLKFEKNVWSQVPLFANEESEGEIVFEGAGITGSIKTSVPEVYRLNKVTSWIAQMLGVPEGETKGETTQALQVLAACANEQNPAPPVPKESQSGPSSLVCTKDEIQIKADENLQGIRHFDESVFEAKEMGGCDGKDINACCGTGGRCVPTQDGISESCDGRGCECEECGNSITCYYYGNHYSSCRVPETEHKFDTAINVKNRVPFLKKIAENTVGEKGFFRLFVPAAIDENKTAVETLENEFRDVAGQSPATISIDNLKVVRPQIRIKPETSTNPITLLFHKIGTMINVKDLVSGVILWPYKPLSEFTDSPSEPVTLTYSIDFRNPNVQVTNKAGVIDMVKNSWPNTKIESQWDYVYNQAVNHGWNPAFVIALWIEESGASGVTFREDLNREVYDLGCLTGEPNNIPSQLDCLFNKAVNRDSSFADFMCSYSEGENAPCIFDTNPNFVGNLKIWYDRLTQ